ncbi:MAG: carboxypeptidase M32 [Planctomycetota bacterium]
MPDQAEHAYRRLTEYLRETAVLRSCRRLLAWDQETYMPRRGAELRARQIALVSGLEHRRRRATEFGALIEEAAPLAEGPDPAARVVANLRETRRDHERARRVPTELVEERARTATLAREAWVEARRQSEFALFRPWLERNLALSRRYAEALGFENSPYDALLDEYEPGETTAHLETLFAPLRRGLVDLVRRIEDADASADADALRGTYPVPAQEAFARRVTAALGFDYERGRLDVTVHPFCSGLAPEDVRLTTRWDERSFVDGLFSVLHEAGHGLYEQGLASGEFGLPTGQACSFGVHEAQSRLWENFVGRSRGFWQFFLPVARQAFPALEKGDLDTFHHALNQVRPSFIRVDADEVTYNLHVFLRLELEQALLTGVLAVRDLPDAWNQRFTAIFGLTPAEDRAGCLQDVHWSAGAFGYFPTYTLGNVYAAQLFARAETDLGDLEEQFARGEFAALLRWLREKIHGQGRRYRPRDLIEATTGGPPSPEPLLRHLEGKYRRIYGL